MTTPDESKMSKARKLLKMAEGAATQGEADAFAEKAMRYMAEHGIEQADLEGADAGAVETEGVRLTGAYTREKAQLLGCIASAKRCLVTVRNRGRKTESATVTGFASDRQTVLELWRSLMVQAERQVATVTPPWYSDDSTTAYRRTWMVGFALKVGQRLAAIEAAVVADADADEPEAPAEGGSTALVLASRTDLVKEQYRRDFPKLGKAKARKLTGSGMADGIQAGARADLGGGRLTTGQKAIR